MSERKVLNKYFPPDFDPAAIPRRRQAKDAQHKVRLMTPYAMRCETCGEYIYKGKKFNARKETVEGETYHSIKIFRFYIKCPRCSAEITFKTDPKNTDYVAEHGASRNFEPWREERLAGEEEKLQKELEEENNPMKALENRTLDSKREMDILDALDEIRTRNARNERIDADAILERMVDEDEKTANERVVELDKKDEQLAKAIFKTADDEVFEKVMRVGDVDEQPEIKDLLSESARETVKELVGSVGGMKRKDINIGKRGTDLGILVKKRKKEDNGKAENKSVTETSGLPVSLLGLNNYESESGSDDDDAVEPSDTG
ncbi:10916_t:CDS:2 [Paraglomus brasilianum]|uniref:Splicing factor YJU2 n=1 Tax=Paraglomus brasilianum TaxID=144538 RepID=A0A9N8WCU4_9GLOM|nr:10916_t:CDS:2 [Paraglomus brasilianum]